MRPALLDLEDLCKSRLNDDLDCMARTTWPSRALGCLAHYTKR